MFKTISHLTDFEERSFIRFLNAKTVKSADIHHLLVEIFGENVMIDVMVRKRVRKFNDGQTNLLNEAQRGSVSVVKSNQNIYWSFNIYLYNRLC